MKISVAAGNVNSVGYTTTDYMVHDNLGSPAAILDASGNLAARFAWDAWGEMVNPATGTGTDPDASNKEALTTIGYTGHEMLWNQGLVHTWARLYNPAIGRWLSPDPTVPNAYDGQSFNRYSYVLNNPLSLWDPLGLSGDSSSCDPGETCLPKMVVVAPPCPMGYVRAGGECEPGPSLYEQIFEMFNHPGYGSPSIRRDELQLSIKPSAMCLGNIAQSNVLSGGQVQVSGGVDSVTITGYGPGNSFSIEARIGGSLPSRLNNLGDIQHSNSGATYQASAIGTFATYDNQGNIHVLNIYQSIAMGNQALMERLSVTGNVSLSQELATYGGKNAPANYASNIASSAGVSGSDTFNSLSPTQQAAVVQALINSEGSVAANVACATSGGN